MPETKLQCEINKSSVERRIRAAFRQLWHKRYFDTVFEHGQWFVQFDDGERTVTFSVADCNNESGFCFEEL